MGFLIPITIGLNLYTVAGLLTVVKYEADHRICVSREAEYERCVKYQLPSKVRTYAEERKLTYFYACDPLTTGKAAYITLAWPVVLWSSYKEYKIKN